MFTYCSSNGILAVGRLRAAADGQPPREVSYMNQLITNFTSWLWAGLPEDVPLKDRVPIMALLAPEHSRAEAMMVARGEVAG